MEFIQNHPKLAISLAALSLVIILLLVLSSTAQQSSSAPIDPTKITSITSPFTKTTTDLDINTDLKNNSNGATVNQPIEIFDLGKLPFTAEMSYKIHETLPTLLAHQIIPTYAHTYAQIDASTIKCSIEYDCSFSIYIDSPESYYTYHAYRNPDGSEAFTLTQEPLPGVSQ